MKDSITLEWLEGVAVAFLDYLEALGRPLLPAEQRHFAFLSVHYESKPIQGQLRALDDDQLEYHGGIMERLREALEPDPVRHHRLVRTGPGVTGESHAGNHAPKLTPGRGVGRRRLTVAEASARVGQLVQLSDSMAAVARDLALVRDRDKDDARRLILIARRMSQAARAFAGKCQADPGLSARPSAGEMLDNQLALREYLGPLEEMG